MKKNILITGVPRSGKSTLFKSIISSVENKVGFITNEIKSNGERTGFEIETSNSKKFILADKSIKTDYQVSKYFVDTESLDKAISSLRKFDKNDLLYLDEIGQMELYSENFRKLTLQYLDSDNLCIATLTKVHTDEFVLDVKSRKDIILVELTEENRSSQAIFVEKLITKIRKAKKYISEPERLKIIGDSIYEFNSDHETRKVVNNEGNWNCSCDFYGKYNICSHIIAVEALT